MGLGFWGFVKVLGFGSGLWGVFVVEKWIFTRLHLRVVFLHDVANEARVAAVGRLVARARGGARGLGACFGLFGCVWWGFELAILSVTRPPVPQSIRSPNTPERSQNKT